MAHDRLIFVLGQPSGGTSAVAGTLHHLGVDMGQPYKPSRPYATFEDRRVRDFSIEAPEGDVSHEIARQPKPWRDFRSYCEMRLQEADGAPCGVKIGAQVWLADPDPATLPIRIVRVLRPLEDSIRSNWHYGGEEDQAAIRRAMQVAGYWACCEELCRHVEPVATIDYKQLLRYRQTHIMSLCSLLGLKPSAGQVRRTVGFLDPELRHV